MIHVCGSKILFFTITGNLAYTTSQKAEYKPMRIFGGIAKFFDVLD